MSTKMKGLLKGLRYISQIFEDEKEPEMQIGFPTDVKHVAHIGWDGPSVDSPSWMKEFKAPANGLHSAPLGPPGEAVEDPEIKWVSEDSSSRKCKSKDSSSKDLPGMPKSSRRQSSENSSGVDSPKKKDSSTKSRSTRRHHSKDSSDGSVRSRGGQDIATGMESPSRNLPDLPKKTRRKKSKESVGGGSSSSRRSKGTNPCADSDNGPDSGSITCNEICRTSMPMINEDEKEVSRIS